MVAMGDRSRDACSHPMVYYHVGQLPFRNTIRLYESNDLSQQFQLQAILYRMLHQMLRNYMFPQLTQIFQPLPEEQVS